jgi:hypothetical protein
MASDLLWTTATGSVFCVLCLLIFGERRCRAFALYLHLLRLRNSDRTTYSIQYTLQITNYVECGASNYILYSMTQEGRQKTGEGGTIRTIH